MSDAPQKSWQSRIAESTDAVAAKFVESISYDRRIYKQDIAGSVAHATMLAKVGLITDAERDAIAGGLKSIEADIEAGNFVFDESLEDIHMVVEDALIKRIGEPGRKLHTGRSRNDQVATDLRLWLSDAYVQLFAQIRELLSTFVKLAERSADIVMPSFTHLQRAQPIVAGAECLGWAEMFRSDENRLWPCRQLMLNPLGSGAIAGSSLPIDRRMTSEELDLGQAVGWYGSSINDTASRDEAAEFLFALAMVSMHLSRWAEQWVIYMTTEFGFIKIADRYTTSSSMMPQKRNPDMLELIRGRCGNVYGDLFALMTILKGLPIGYNRDLQEDKRIVFRAYDTVSSCLTMAAAIVNSASYDKARIEPTLGRGFLDATSLAEYLVTKGIAFRTAHGIVGSLVARCEKEGKHALTQLGVEAFNETIAAAGSDTRVTDDLYACLGAANVVRRYQSAGAAGGKPFEDQLAAWKKRFGLGKDGVMVTRTTGRFQVTPPTNAYLWHLVKDDQMFKLDTLLGKGIWFARLNQFGNQTETREAMLPEGNRGLLNKLLGNQVGEAVSQYKAVADRSFASCWHHSNGNPNEHAWKTFGSDHRGLAIQSSPAHVRRCLQGMTEGANPTITFSKVTYIDHFDPGQTLPDGNALDPVLAVRKEWADEEETRLLIMLSGEPARTLAKHLPAVVKATTDPVRRAEYGPMDGLEAGGDAIVIPVDPKVLIEKVMVGRNADAQFEAQARRLMGEAGLADRVTKEP